jgi:predicted ribosome quality control (RQC) complex YloA/Tae2 family protein
MRFESSNGFAIYAGKNNTQNDLLTMKTAGKTDVWLHAKGVPGSHVIISCGGAQPDEQTLLEAAAIAAYYSAARSAGKVAVDHTFVKHVKRQPTGRPGMVTYTDQKTIIAIPDEGLVESLRRG